MREQIQRYAHETLSIELAEAQRLCSRLNDSFVSACEAILACTGKIVVTGIGKSGHIGKKIAATLASTGSPAFFRPSRRGAAWRFGHDHQGIWSS